MLFQTKVSHRDMADVNVYTASRLGEMASSLNRLARSFASEDTQARLTKEDGMAAMQAATALVCGDCRRCSIYKDSIRDDNYYLFYLLRAFENRGEVLYEDMPPVFGQVCGHRNEYLSQLNYSLGKASMNLGWKLRFLESRDSVVAQFRELAVMMEEFSRQMEQAVDVTREREEEVRRAFARHRMRVTGMLVLEYENLQREAYLTVQTVRGTCLTVREAAEIFGGAMGKRRWRPAEDSRVIVTRKPGTLRLMEEGKYQLICGAARAPGQDGQVSGDGISCIRNPAGQVILSIADGMGSGAQAGRESSRVLELMEQLMGAGFSARSALKLVNTVLLLTGEEQHPLTLDLVCVDLNTGVLQAMKLGAVPAFLITREGVKKLEAQEPPLGVLETVEPQLISRKLWEEDRIVMVSDGVLDALPGENREQTFLEFLEQLPPCRPQELADCILNFVSEACGGACDDQTVLTAGIWERK